MATLNIFLLLIASKCVLSVIPDFVVYNKNEFKITLPLPISTFSIQAVHDELHESVPEEEQFIVNDNIIRASGNNFNLVRGSDINYTIGYKDDVGFHSIHGRYIFNGVYHDLRPRRYLFENRNYLEQRRGHDFNRSDEDSSDEDSNESYSGERRGKNYQHRRPPGLFKPHAQPPFGHHRGPGMPHPPPFTGGPERFPPRHHPHFPHMNHGGPHTNHGTPFPSIHTHNGHGHEEHQGQGHDYVESHVGTDYPSQRPNQPEKTDSENGTPNNKPIRPWETNFGTGSPNQKPIRPVTEDAGSIPTTTTAFISEIDIRFGGDEGSTETNLDV